MELIESVRVSSDCTDQIYNLYTTQRIFTVPGTVIGGAGRAPPPPVELPGGGACMDPRYPPVPTPMLTH